MNYMKLNDFMKVITDREIDEYITQSQAGRIRHWVKFQFNQEPMTEWNSKDLLSRLHRELYEAFNDKLKMEVVDGI